LKKSNAKKERWQENTQKNKIDYSLFICTQRLGAEIATLLEKGINKTKKKIENVRFLMREL
jgi:hypothetical protein